MSTVHPSAAARFDLSGTVAWVIGGGGLLGAEVCGALAEHGARVVVSGPDGDAASVADRLTARGLAAEADRLDVGDAAAVDACVDGIVERHGRLDACVNLAAFHCGQSYDELTPSGLQAGFQISLVGAFLAGRAAARAMTGRGGRIVQFGSMYGMVSPDPANYPDGLPINPVDYGMAKAAINQLVRYEAVHLGPQDILVNAVVPGPFPNPEGQGTHEEFVGRLSSRVPLGRVGRAPEIAGAVVYLCSPAASFVTGTQLVVDGGWTAW